jgi:hypothetical protein
MMIDDSRMLNGAGDLAVLAKIQQCIVAEAVKPNASPGVAITDTHRN